MTRKAGGSRSAATPPKKVERVEKAKKPKPELATRLTYSKMILEAMGRLNHPKGSSMYAIKKYISNKHKMDIDNRVSANLKQALMVLLVKEELRRMSGKGVTGRFKLTGKAKTTSAAATASSKKRVEAEKGVSNKKSAPSTKTPAKKFAKMPTLRRQVVTTTPISNWKMWNPMYAPKGWVPPAEPNESKGS